MIRWKGVVISRKHRTKVCTKHVCLAEWVKGERAIIRFKRADVRLRLSVRISVSVKITDVASCY